MDESLNIPQRTALYKQPLVVGLALVFIIAILLYIYEYRQAERESKRIGLFREGREAMISGDSKKAISDLTEALRLTSDIQQEVSAKNSLGVSFLFSADTSDQERGIAILKEIVNNESYPKEFRGGAMHRILGAFLSAHDHQLAKEHIFTNDEEPWRSFIADDASVNEALRRAYTWLNDLSPSPGSEYALTQWYGEELYIDKVTGGDGLDTDTREKYKVKLLEHLRRGDELFPLILSYDGLEDWEKSGNMFFRALAHMFAYLVFEEKPFKERAEESFASAIQMQEGLPAEYAPLLRSSSSIRYWYAFFIASLAESERENRKEEIARLLDPVVAPEAFLYLVPYLTNIKGMSGESADMATHVLVANTLARNDDRFKEHLKKIGWEEL